MGDIGDHASLQAGVNRPHLPPAGWSGQTLRLVLGHPGSRGGLAGIHHGQDADPDGGGQVGPCRDDGDEVVRLIGPTLRVPRNLPRFYS